ELSAKVFHFCASSPACAMRWPIQIRLIKSGVGRKRGSRIGTGKNCQDLLRFGNRSGCGVPIFRTEGLDTARIGWIREKPGRWARGSVRDRGARAVCRAEEGTPARTASRVRG